MTMKVVYLKI